MSIDEFFEELKTSGLKFAWDGNLIREVRAVTLHGRDDYHFCPICALCAHKGLGNYGNSCMDMAGAKLGLSKEDVVIIMRAADNPAMPMRAKFLEVLCL